MITILEEKSVLHLEISSRGGAELRFREFKEGRGETEVPRI